MDDKQNIEVGSDNPKLDVLLKELQDSITYSSDYVQQCRKNDDVRLCVWDGQTDDGKKWSDNFGEEVFPWEGSSDARIRTADKAINERVMVQMAAFFQNKMQATLVESDDIVTSQKATGLIKWMLYNHTLKEMTRETELILNFKETYGACLQGIFWKREMRTKIQKLDVQSLTEMAMQTQNAQLIDLLNAIFDPTQHEGLAQMLVTAMPSLTESDAKEIIEELRTKGETEFPVPYLFKNQPTWKAYRFFVDAFIEPGIKDVQDGCRYVFIRDWTTESDLRDGINVEGYGKAWVEEVVKNNRGVSAVGQLDQLVLTEKKRGGNRTIDDYKNLYEIFHGYYIAIYRGTPCLYCTTFHPNVKDKVAKHEKYGDAHGQLPFVEHVREWLAPSILESRGVPEIVTTNQNEIKTQRDYRADRSSIAIMPPVKVPANRGKLQLIFGPAKQLPERRPGEIEWMRPPAFDPGSNETEMSAQRDVDEYFGLLGPNADPRIVMLHQQHLVNKFLTEMTLAFQLTWALMQQNLTDQQVARVVGQPMGPRSIEEIQGQFDIIMTFDVRELDMEFLKQKLAFVKDIVGLDTVGVLDRAKMVGNAMAAVDINWAREIVKPIENVTQAEIEDEQSQFAKMFAGVEPPMKEGGQNYGLRLQTLQNILQTNPMAQQRMANPDDSFAKLVETRMKHFEFQLQQQQNAVIGRIGVKPALGASAA